jgi:hypothetical protein
MSRSGRLPLTLIALLVCITTASFLNDVFGNCTDEPDPCYQIDQQVLAHTAQSPYRYRILAPDLMSLGATPTTHWAWFSAGLALHIVCFLIIDLTLYVWLRPQVGEAKALIGLCIMALMTIYAFHRYYLTPTSIIEVALLCLLLVAWRRWWLVASLVILASLNRETALLLVVVYGVYSGRSGLRRTGILLTLWAIMTAMLHLTLGAAPHVLGLIGTLQSNTERLGQSLFINLLILPLWIMVLTAYRKSDNLLHKRLVWVALIYMGTVAVGGMWDEVGRMALPAVVLVLPLILENGPSFVPVNNA